jgi:hypothetical protein
MASPTPKNRQNATPQSKKNDFCENVVFAIPSIQKMYPGATFCFRIASPTPKNLKKSNPQSKKNDLFENVVFAIPSMQKRYPGAVWVAFCKGWGPKYLLLATPGRDKMSSELSFGCYLHGAGSEIPACS